LALLPEKPASVLRREPRSRWRWHQGPGDQGVAPRHCCIEPARRLPDSRKTADGRFVLPAIGRLVRFTQSPRRDCIGQTTQLGRLHGGKQTRYLRGKTRKWTATSAEGGECGARRGGRDAEAVRGWRLRGLRGRIQPHEFGDGRMRCSSWRACASGDPRASPRHGPSVARRGDVLPEPTLSLLLRNRAGA
jgi:hypothetical protein